MLFLENRKIRQWPIEERSGLSQRGDAWLAAFHKYLTDAECPLLGEFSPALVPQYVTWLVTHAVAIDYEDQGEARRPQLPQSWSGLGDNLGRASARVHGVNSRHNQRVLCSIFVSGVCGRVGVSGGRLVGPVHGCGAVDHAIAAAWPACDSWRRRRCRVTTLPRRVRPWFRHGA